MFGHGSDVAWRIELQRILNHSLAPEMFPSLTLLFCPNEFPVSSNQQPAHSLPVALLDRGRKIWFSQLARFFDTETMRPCHILHHLQLWLLQYREFGLRRCCVRMLTGLSGVSLSYKDKNDPAWSSRCHWYLTGGRSLGIDHKAYGTWLVTCVSKHSCRTSQVRHM